MRPAFARRKKMAYFKLKFNSGSSAGLPAYPFDFHSHWNGILPLESDLSSQSEIGFNDFKIHVGQPLSIIGMLEKPENEKGYKDPEIVKKAHFKLFRMALKYVVNTLGQEINPFSNGVNMAKYQRGECTMENIYLACCLLACHIGVNDVCNINDPAFYKTILDLCGKDDGIIKNQAAYEIIAYFNRKVFSANKYTPFDDAYWARDAIKESKYADAFNWMALCHMYESGVRFAQVATSPGSIKSLDATIEDFRKSRPDANYKLLAHSPKVFNSENEFTDDLNKSILPLFVNEKRAQNLVGIDLLSSEVSIGNYKAFFEFLKTNKEQLKAKSNKTIIHIHCGEGSGISGNNRSLCGYWLANAERPGLGAFCSKLAAYAEKCYQNTLDRNNARERNRSNLALGGQPKQKPGKQISNLFDEFFFWNNLVVDGLQVRRFDITGEESRSLAEHNAKLNIEHLCNTLAASSSVEGKNYYQLLCDAGDNTTLFSFRIGHAYQDRNYLFSKFPALYYDTNLGSNFITGASALFDSAQLYRLNRGFRHLDGHIDTDILQKALDSVAYMGKDRLPDWRSQFIGSDWNGLDSENLLNQCGLLGSTRNVAKTFLETAWELSADKLEAWRSALIAIVLNWRSYMFGADGQGVEHSDVEIEAARMALMLAYGADGYKSEEAGGGGPSSAYLVIPANFIIALAQFFQDLALEYWKYTIGNCNTPNPPFGSHLAIKGFEGFKSPRSVVLVTKPNRIEPQHPAA
jgi:hypothetical protein